MNRSSIGLVLAVGLATAGCARRVESRDDTAGAPMPPVDSAAFHLDPATAISLELWTVTLHDEPRDVRAIGTVQADERQVARVLAPVAGQVSGLHVNIGDRVQEGEPIFFLRSRGATAAMKDAIDALHDLDLAGETLAMTRDRYDHQAASRAELQQAEADVARGRARVYRTEASLGAIGISAPYDLSELDPRVPVTSPITGVVLERRLSEGQYVQPDSTPLLTIADLSRVETEQAITVPASAVLTDGDRSFVYVAIDDHTFARRAVEASPDGPDRCRIIRGLKEGDRIVTNGAGLLRDQESHGTS